MKLFLIKLLLKAGSAKLLKTNFEIKADKEHQNDEIVFFYNWTPEHVAEKGPTKYM